MFHSSCVIFAFHYSWFPFCWIGQIIVINLSFDTPSVLKVKVLGEGKQPWTEEIQIQQTIIEFLLCVRFCIKCFTYRNPAYDDWTNHRDPYSSTILALFSPQSSPPLPFLANNFCYHLSSCSSQNMGHLWLYPFPHQPCPTSSSHIPSSLHPFCAHWSPYLENSFPFPSLANFYLFFKFSSSMMPSLSFIVPI